MSKSKKPTGKMKDDDRDRVDGALFDERVYAVMDLMIQGWPRRKIIQIVSTNEKFMWDVVPRQIDNYIAKAKEIIKASAVFDRDEEIGAAIERYRDLFAKSSMLHDYKACLAISKELTELLGLKPKQQLELSGKLKMDGKMEIVLRRINSRDEVRDRSHKVT